MAYTDIDIVNHDAFMRAVNHDLPPGFDFQNALNLMGSQYLAMVEQKKFADFSSSYTFVNQAGRFQLLEHWLAIGQKKAILTVLYLGSEKSATTPPDLAYGI